MKEKRFLSLVVCFFAILFVISCGSMTTAVQEAKELLKNGRYQDAAVALEKEIEKNPKNRDANYYLAVSYLNMGRIDDADKMFYTAVENKEDQERKAWLKNEIAKEYREVFFRYLANVNQFERDKARTLMNAALSYNSTPEFIGAIADRLQQKGVQSIGKHTMDQANEYFAYLNTLYRKRSGQIAEAFIEAYKKALGDDEFQTVLIRRAIVFNQDEATQKLFSEHYFSLSQKAPTTEKAVSFLETANVYGNRYIAEFQAKKEQLELEKMLELVKKNEEKLGQAQHVRLDKSNDSKLAGTISKSSKITYLSTRGFRVKYNTGKIEDWEAAIKKETWFKIYHTSDMVLTFEAINGLTDIYFWPEKI